MNWQGRDGWRQTIETSLRGLGYELVDAERSAGGLLRVTIDHLPADDLPEAAEQAITVDDCERATRQLQRVLEVEGVDYQRLEVSSPGLDRPLKRAADYARFAGQPVELTLKVAFQGRKRWQGELQANGDGWQLVLPEDDAAPKAAGKPAPRAAGKPAPKAMNKAAPRAPKADGARKVLAFNLDEVREAHLVPVVDFKGRGRDAASPGARPATGAPVDGGRIR